MFCGSLKSCTSVNSISLSYFDIFSIHIHAISIRLPIVYLKGTQVERGSCMVWEINMGVCQRLDFDNFMLILRILINTEEKPYDKSVHTGEEPYIYDFIIVRLINKPASQK